MKIIKLLSGIALLSHNVLFSSPLLYKMRFMMPAVTASVAGMLAHKEYKEDKMYEQGVLNKLDFYGYPQIQGDVMSLIKKRELIAQRKFDPKLAALGYKRDWFWVLTQFIMLKNGVSIRLGRLLIKQSDSLNGPFGAAAGSSKPLVLHFRNSDNENTEMFFFLRTPTIYLSLNFYENAKKAFNPLYLLRNKNIETTYQRTYNPYSVKAHIPVSLFQNIYKGILCHEGQHVNQFLNNTIISQRAAEIDADNATKSLAQIKASLLSFNLDKLWLTYSDCDWSTVFNDTMWDKKRLKIKIQDYNDSYRENCIEMAHSENKIYNSDDFHPDDDQRIAMMKEKLGSYSCTGTQEVVVNIYENEKEVITLVLKESEDFDLEKAVNRALES